MKTFSNIVDPINVLLGSLIENGKKYLSAENGDEFTQQIEIMVLANGPLMVEPLDFFFKDVEDLLERSKQSIPLGKRSEYEGLARRAILDSKIALIETLGKQAEGIGRLEEPMGGVYRSWHELRRKVEMQRRDELAGEIASNWHELRRKVEMQRRRLALLSPLSEQDLIATLMWMTDLGGEEELGLVRAMTQRPPFPSEEIKRLIEEVERRMSGRIAGSIDSCINNAI
jgi:hypothetical protein